MELIVVNKEDSTLDESTLFYDNYIMYVESKKIIAWALFLTIILTGSGAVSSEYILQETTNQQISN